jgi:hypothetical protein
MFALLYRSRARPGLLASDLNAIIKTAEARNREIGITGILLYGQLAVVPGAPGEFVQWIEGDKESVEALYADIATDERHFDPEVLARGLIGELRDGVRAAGPSGRLFPTWSMALVRLSELPATLPGFLAFARDWEGDALPAVA